MTWIAPKLDWTLLDVNGEVTSINFADFNRIENNIMELYNYLTSLGYTLPPLSENTSALSFDGVDDHVTLSTGQINTTLNSSAWTIEFWANINKTDKGLILGPKSSISGRLIGSYWGATTQLSIVEENVAVIDGVPVDYGRWMHISFTYDGANVRGYKNGVLVFTKAYVFTAPYAGAYTIGTPNNVAWASEQGSVDEFRIWNVVRTQTQIQDAMTKQLVGNESGLVGYWDFNAGSGTTAIDKTANANNGTLVGGTAWTTLVPSVGVIKNRTISSIDFLSSINRVENNLDAIKLASISPIGYLGKKTWAVGVGFDYTDANRLEANTKQLYDLGLQVFQSFKYCGTFNAGQSGGLA